MFSSLFIDKAVWTFNNTYLYSMLHSCQCQVLNANCQFTLGHRCEFGLLVHCTVYVLVDLDFTAVLRVRYYFRTFSI